jgi:CDP-Glycerol:Poly(glycerophosphate) glycerophosphotransferase
MPLLERGKDVARRWWEVARAVRRLDPSKAVQVASLIRSMAGDRLSGRRVVILFVEEPGFVQFMAPIVVELKEMAPEVLSFYIATSYAENEVDLTPFGLQDALRFDPELAPLLLPASVFLSASVYGMGPPTAVRINISHNQPTKFEAYPKEYVRNYDAHFMTGPLHREQYEHMFELHGLDTSRYRLLDVGYPKSDALLQGRYDRRKVLGDLRLRTDRQTVLYAPAWDPGGSLRSFGECVVEGLLSIPDLNVIVKLHPVSHTPPSSPNFEFYTGGVNWAARFRKYESNPRFRHVTDFRVDPLLLVSDVMVTDFSSVALEFIVLDRPVIYLDCPEYFANTLKMPGYITDPDYAKNDPRANAGRHLGVVVEDVANLATAVRDCLSFPARNSAARRELAAKLLYNPARGAAVAARTVLELMGITLPQAI